MITSPPRHAELVSASMLHPAKSVQFEKWTLKQVQGDEIRELETAQWS
jgi:hypothetical protein